MLLKSIVEKDTVNNQDHPVETNWIPLEIVHNYMDDFRIDNVQIILDTKIGFHTEYIKVEEKSYIDSLLSLIDESNLGIKSVKMLVVILLLIINWLFKLNYFTEFMALI